MPSTATTYSERTSTVPGTTHWMMPVWSRTSRKARCSPCSRRFATQPHTVTVRPTSAARSVPHWSERIEVAPLDDGWASGGTVTLGPFGWPHRRGRWSCWSRSRGVRGGVGTGGRPHRGDHLRDRHGPLVTGVAQGPE